MFPCRVVYRWGGGGGVIRVPLKCNVVDTLFTWSRYWSAAIPATKASYVMAIFVGLQAREFNTGLASYPPVSHRYYVTAVKSQAKQEFS